MYVNVHNIIFIARLYRIYLVVHLIKFANVYIYVCRIVVYYVCICICIYLYTYIL